jgi:transmembrane sensor
MTQESNKKRKATSLSSDNSNAEAKPFLKWLQKDKEDFKASVIAELLLAIKFNSFNSKEGIDLFFSEIKPINSAKSKRKKILNNWLKFAAIFTGLLITTTYTIHKYNKNEAKLAFSLIKTSGITLKINGDDNAQIIENTGVKTITSNSGNEIGTIQKDILTYKRNTNSKDQFAPTNTLSVPYGKTFDVVLSDGTYVYLNAGSVLTYPSHFNGALKREVFLRGEGYFKVAKNKNIPFIVKTETLDTRVYGTEFNVSAYNSDSVTEVVLVEGSVGVKGVTKTPTSSNKYLVIKPSQKASKKRALNILEIEKVDVKPYISWKVGVLAFNNENIANIFQKLERKFNVKIKNNYSDLYKHSYTGIFKSENVNEVLFTLSNHTNFYYTINGNKITIKKNIDM